MLDFMLFSRLSYCSVIVLRIGKFSSRGGCLFQGSLREGCVFEETLDIVPFEERGETP